MPLGGKNADGFIEKLKEFFIVNQKKLYQRK
jgi:hypothetical protein